MEVKIVFFGISGKFAGFLSCFSFTISPLEFIILSGIRSIFSVISLKLFSLLDFSSVFFSFFHSVRSAVLSIPPSFLLVPLLTDNNTRLWFCFHFITIIRRIFEKRNNLTPLSNALTSLTKMILRVYTPTFKFELVCMNWCLFGITEISAQLCYRYPFRTNCECKHCFQNAVKLRNLRINTNAKRCCVTRDSVGRKFKQWFS